MKYQIDKAMPYFRGILSTKAKRSESRKKRKRK
jgi:hypothetical protein